MRKLIAGPRVYICD
ncbi:hypothetical protein QJS66_01525 [Kocuria rhizophila]|nr:hypothetical protein QJS66_01525 [Kocuria rhizophila]